MKLLLVRHAETVDNIERVYAGITDSAITVHGSLQAQRLGEHLAKTRPKLTHIFSSDLQRAFQTAEAVLFWQQKNFENGVELVSQSVLLREQDFGRLEKAPFTRRSKSHTSTDRDFHKQYGDREGPTGAETKTALTARANGFIDQYIIPLLQKSTPRSEPVVVVVSHGMLLGALWKSVLNRFVRASVNLSQEIMLSGVGPNSLEHIGPWANTGFLELHIHRLPFYMRTISTEKSSDAVAMDIDNQLLHDWTVVIKNINCVDHLQGLKRIRGGVGSSQVDQNQRTIEGFFKKQRTS